MDPRLINHVEIELLQLVHQLLSNHVSNLNRHQLALKLIDLLQAHSWECPIDLVRAIINGEDVQALQILNPILQRTIEQGSSKQRRSVAKQG
jgi:hypothetical protein